MNTKLVAHHIGGRNGSVAFMPSPGFLSDFVNVLYDADEDCTSQIQESTQGGNRKNVEIISACIGQKKERLNFNITYDPFGSSLFTLNQKFSKYTAFVEPYDYVSEDAARPMVAREVDVIDLDTLLQERPSTLPPDVLSVDTEGCEWEILMGSRRTIERNVVAIISEVAFQEYRLGQKRFIDVQLLLDQLGFDFVCFRDMHNNSSDRTPIGLRGCGFDLVADALFIRRIDSIPAMSSDPGEQAMVARKLALVAFEFGLIEYGLAALNWAGQVGAPLSPATGSAWERFLAKVELVVEAMPKSFPPLYSEVLTFEESLARSRPTSVNQHTIPWKRKAKDWMLAHPKTLATVRKIRWMMGWVTKTFTSLVHAAQRAKSGHTDFERLLKEFGMEEVASMVRARRLAELPFGRSAK